MFKCFAIVGTQILAKWKKTLKIKEKMEGKRRNESLDKKITLKCESSKC